MRHYAANMPKATFSVQELINQYKIFNYSIRALWNGLYKTEIINENRIAFDENMRAGAEDYAFNLEYFNYVSHVSLIEYPVYKHFSREEQSASFGFNENRQNCIIKVYHTEAKLLRDYEISSETYIRHQLWYFYMLVRELSFRDTALRKEEILERLKRFAGEMELFKKLRPAEKIRTFMKMPKSMIQWELLRSGNVEFLYWYHKRRHG